MSVCIHSSNVISIIKIIDNTSSSGSTSNINNIRYVYYTCSLSIIDVDLSVYISRILGYSFIKWSWICVSMWSTIDKHLADNTLLVYGKQIPPMNHYIVILFNQSLIFIHIYSSNYKFSTHNHNYIHLCLLMSSYTQYKRLLYNYQLSIIIGKDTLSLLLHQISIKSSFHQD